MNAMTAPLRTLTAARTNNGSFQSAGCESDTESHTAAEYPAFACLAGDGAGDRRSADDLCGENQSPDKQDTAALRGGAVRDKTLGQCAEVSPRLIRTNRGQLCVVFVDRIAGDTDIMVPIEAIRERDPEIMARARRYDDGADFDYAMEAEAHGVSVDELLYPTREAA